MASPLPLYTIPPEIWLSILAHLTEPDFLSLKHSSPHLRRIITDNAATICNTLITKYYAQEAAILGTTFHGGWLVPTLPAIVREEKQLARYASRSNSLVRSSRSSRDTSPSSPSSQLQMQMQDYRYGGSGGNTYTAPLPPPVRTKLSEPGPQYLRFLIEYSFEIRVANSMFIDVPARGRAVGVGTAENDNETPQEKLDRWVGLYTVRRFLGRLHKIAKGAESSPFSSFGSDGSSRTLGDDQSLAFLRATADGLAWFYE